MTMLRDQMFYNLQLPTDRLAHDVVSPLRVSSHDSIQKKQALETLATYANRELQWDLVPFDSEENDEQDDFVPWNAYLFHGESMPPYEFDDRYKNVLYFGACCFREKKNDDKSPRWELDWVWLHPYFRRRGWLTRAWPVFKRDFGTFEVSAPLDEAMKSFLLKHSGQ